MVTARAIRRVVRDMLISGWRKASGNSICFSTTFEPSLRTITSKVVVSADGKTRTVTQVGMNAQGQPLNVTSVYEKQ